MTQVANVYLARPIWERPSPSLLNFQKLIPATNYWHQSLGWAGRIKWGKVKDVGGAPCFNSASLIRPESTIFLDPVLERGLQQLHAGVREGCGIETSFQNKLGDRTCLFRWPGCLREWRKAGYSGYSEGLRLTGGWDGSRVSRFVCMHHIHGFAKCYRPLRPTVFLQVGS